MATAPADSFALPLKEEHRSSRGHFIVLDAMRGLAAVAVLLHHIGKEVGLSISPHGYLAVDFFVMLSGFVIGKAYEDRLSAGMGLGSFLRIRCIRLYPMIFAGSALGTAAYYYANSSFGSLYFWVILQFLLIPCVFTGILFPANSAFWSLFYEVIENFLHATVFYRLDDRVIYILLAVLFPIEGIILIKTQMFNHGFQTGQFALGAVRLTLDYLIGVAIWRLFRNGTTLHFNTAWFVPMSILAMILFSPQSLKLKPLILLAYIVFPLVIVAGLRCQTVHNPYIMRWLGKISYPLYAIHLPLIMACEAAGFLRLGISGGWFRSLLVSIAIIIIASLLEIYYDLPIRRRLGNKKTLKV